MAQARKLFLNLTGKGKQARANYTVGILGGYTLNSSLLQTLEARPTADGFIMGLTGKAPKGVISGPGSQGTAHGVILGSVARYYLGHTLASVEGMDSEKVEALASEAMALIRSNSVPDGMVRPKSWADTLVSSDGQLPTAKSAKGKAKPAKG